ncbi:MAG: phosphopentomutase [Defluviitaleaceae bacterium]|nr:phosphopentomutase [Defluviitaleaceae bacterium]
MKSIIIILDSAGIGADFYAHEYGDEAANTLMNIKKAVPSMKLPNLIKLGLSHIEGCGILADGSDISAKSPAGSYARLMAKSKGKDTTTGHWEIAGLVTKDPFPTYPNGFPPDVIEAFEEKTGRKTLANRTASGTEIIAELGAEHMQSEDLIVYTSADSVFQIAAHEEIVPLKDLYKYCQIARDILKPPHGVARVIARPFIGSPGKFVRTANRHDFSLPPPAPTMLDFIAEKGLSVHGIGKIYDIFVGAGITKNTASKSNMDGVDKLLEAMKSTDEGLIFINLVDFDMLYGHRNDAEGYANALMEFDARLPEILSLLGEDDILYLTADHGCDPTTKGTDHTREYVPLIIYGENLRQGVNFGTKEGFGHVAATVLDHLGTAGEVDGESLLGLLRK